MSTKNKKSILKFLSSLLAIKSISFLLNFILAFSIVFIILDVFSLSLLNGIFCLFMDVPGTNFEPEMYLSALHTFFVLLLLIHCDLVLNIFIIFCIFAFLGKLYIKKMNSKSEDIIF